VTRTTSAGALVGWMSIRDPNVCPRRVSGEIPTIVPEYVVRQAVTVAAEELARDPLQEALVRLPPHRLHGQRTAAHRVVADCGDAVLRDRELQPERSAQCDDLRARLTRRQEPVRGRRPRLRGLRRAAGPEGGEQKRDEERDRNHDQTGDSPGSSSCRGSSLGRAARLPGGTGRGHAPHRNRCLRVLQKHIGRTAL
jgi:hypothetical protein